MAKLKTIDTNTSPVVSLDESSFGALADNEKVVFLSATADNLEAVVAWLDSHGPGSPSADELGEVLNKLGDKLGLSEAGRTLLKRLMTAKGRLSALKVPKEVRSKSGKKAARYGSKKSRQEKASRGGTNAAESMTAEQRSERARKAAEARWSKTPRKPR